MLSVAKLVHGERSASGTGGLECFSDGKEHADFVVGGQLNDFSNLFRIKADHGTGVVTHSFSSEHEGLTDNTDGAKGFIVLELRFIAVKLMNHGDDGFLNAFGGLAPIALGLFMCFEVCTEH